MPQNDSLLLQTPRLELRPFGPTDAYLIGRILRDPRIIFWRKKRMSWRLLRGGIRNSIKMNKWGLGWWLIFSRDSKNTLIGVLLLQPLNNTSDIEIGYHLRRDQWGKGYATEAAGLLLEHAFATLGLPQICAIALPYNRRSIRVIEKLGLRQSKNYLHRGLNHRYFKLDRDDYLAQRHRST